MKTFFTIILLTSSIFCFGQIKSENLVGNWKSDNNKIFNDSAPSFLSKKFVLNIKKNKSFQIRNPKKMIHGTWFFKDSILYLAKKAEDKNIKKRRLKVYSLTKTELILKLEGIKSEKALLKLVRVKRRK